jgi:hypothetical protein
MKGKVIIGLRRKRSGGLGQSPLTIMLALLERGLSELGSPHLENLQSH